ncbi:MAG: alpha/beta hydrolase family protein [Acidobacteriota bacterium]
MRNLVIALVLAGRLAQAGTCPGNALVTLDDGAIVNVEWPERTASEVRGRAITNATQLTEYQLALRPDGSVSDAYTTARTLEGKPADRRLSVAAGAVFWSDKLPSTLEQIVLRARAAGAASERVALVAASKDVPHAAQVERIDADDYSVDLGPRRYDVIVDDQGCLLGATLAAYGITIERRQVAADAYPLEGAYTAPHGAPYTATEVKIAAPQGHVLAGTLTRPTRGGRVPAVVMITGISKHERNEGNPPYTPFRDLADVLGRAGIAVLRVDDRGVGASTGDFAKATSFDEADDVRSELAWLREQPGIDPKRLGLVGHSEGGFIALVVAAGDPSLAAIVLLAGSGVPGEQLNTWQTIQAVNHDPSIAPAAREAEIAKQLADRHDWSPRDVAFVAADPADYARKVKTPTLLVQGGSDLHVPPRSAERLVATMRAAGNRDVTARIIPHLSHTLSPDVIGSVQAWSWLPSRRLSNELLATVRDWLAGELTAR